MNTQRKRAVEPSSCDATHEADEMRRRGKGDRTGVDKLGLRRSPSPTKCLSVRGGKAVDGSDITLSDCPADKEPAQMRFVLPENGTGLIRWAAHPGMCLDAGGGQSGDLFRLWTCDAGHPAMQFVLPVQPVCKTAGVEGVACALPFTYRGVKYERCTWKDHINPWCATQVLRTLRPCACA